MISKRHAALPDRAAMRRICEIANVPAGRRQKFARNLRSQLIWWNTFAKHWDGSSLGLIRELNRLVNASTAYHTELLELHDSTRLHFNAHLQRIFGDHVPEPFLASQAPHASFHIHMVGMQVLAAKVALDLVSGPPTRVGRKPDLGHHALDWFVRDVLRATDGKLTLDKNNGTGSLVKFLEEVKPFLPSKFIPDALPISRLQRLKTHWTRIRTTDAALMS